ADDTAYRGPLSVTALDAYGRSAGRLRRQIRLEPGGRSVTAFTLRTKRLGHRGWDDARPDAPSNTSDPSWLDTTTYERWVDALRANDISVVATLFGVP